MDDLKELMTGRICRCDPRHPLIPLRKRIGHAPCSFIGIGPNQIRFGEFSFAGPDHFVVSKQFSFPAPRSDESDGDPKVLDPITTLPNSHYTVILLGRRVEVKKEAHSTVRSEPEELELLMSGPQKILAGSTIDSAREYRTLVQPDGTSCLSASVERKLLRTLIESVHQLGKTVVRIESSLLALLNLALGSGYAAYPKQAFGVLVLDQGTAAWMRVNDAGHWIGDFRSPSCFAPLATPDAKPTPQAAKQQEQAIHAINADLAKMPVVFVDTHTSAFPTDAIANLQLESPELNTPPAFLDVYAASRF